MRIWARIGKRDGVCLFGERRAHFEWERVGKYFHACARARIGVYIRVSRPRARPHISECVFCLLFVFAQRAFDTAPRGLHVYIYQLVRVDIRRIWSLVTPTTPCSHFSRRPSFFLSSFFVTDAQRIRCQCKRFADSSTRWWIAFLSYSLVFGVLFQPFGFWGVTDTGARVLFFWHYSLLAAACEISSMWKSDHSE